MNNDVHRFQGQPRTLRRALPGISRFSRIRTDPRASVPTRRCLVLTLLIATTGLSLAGCDNFNPFSKEIFLEMEVPPEQLREIKPMKVEEFASEDQGASAAAPEDFLEAPETMDMTLEECRKRALENNLDLSVALFSPAITATSITEEEARFESAFTASAGYRSTEQQTTSTLASSSTDIFDGSLGVRIPLRTGGTANVELPFNRVDRENAFNTINPSYETQLRLSLTQQLLRGAGLRANTSGIRIAHYQTQEVEARTKLEVTRILAEIDRQYWLLFAARRELEVRQMQYELAIAQYDRAKRLVDAEEAAEVEVLRAESGVADRLDEIIVSENRVRNRQRALKRLLNMPELPMDGKTVMIPTTEPNPINLELDSEQLMQIALEQRMEMLEIELQIAANASTIDFERNQALPMLAMEYSYGLNGVDDSFGDTWSTISEFRYTDWRVGVSAEVQIGNEGAKARVHRAILRRLQTLATKELRESTIRQEVLNSIDNLRASWQRVLASRQRVIVAARTLAAEERQFTLGLRTSTDVLDAQARLADAQSSEIAALTTYQVSQTDLAFATGMVLGQAQVRWAPYSRPEQEAYSRN